MCVGLPGRQHRLEEADHAVDESSQSGRPGGIVAVAGDSPVIHRGLHDQCLLCGIGVVAFDGNSIARRLSQKKHTIHAICTIPL